MKSLCVRDALCQCQHIVRVCADDRPTPNRQTSTIYAVFVSRPEGGHGDRQEALAGPLRGGFHEALVDPLRGGFQEALAGPLRGGFQEALAGPLRGGFQEALAGPLRGGFQEALAGPLRGGFLGLVTEREIALFPQRIFADLLDPHALPPLAPDVALEQVYGPSNDIAYGFESPLAVVEDGQFIGVITRSSVLEALLTREHQLLDETQRLNEQLEEDKAQLSAWTSRLGELHDASRTLLSLLVHTTLDTDLLLAGVEALAKLLQARYGAIGILDSRGELKQFVHYGVTAEEAERIGRLPEGRGLLGVVVKEDQTLRLDDMARDSRSTGFPPQHPPMKALLAVPISHLGHVYGRIYLCDRWDGKPFSVDDELLAQSFAHSLSLVLDNAREIEETKQAMSRLDFMAHHDSLTGLPNRELFADRLRQAIVQHARHDRYVAVLFLDLDNFKVINDTLGHVYGDELLKGVSDRLLGAIRESDTLARLGGDEFTVLLLDMEDPHYAAAVAQKLLDTVAPPFSLGEHETYVTVSIGISVYPPDGVSMEQLLKNADMSMYHAKAQGKNNFQFFAADMNSEAQRRLEMERQLRRALQLGELSLHYQPQTDLDSGEIVGVEALLRWSNPTLGTVSPSEFIPLAEETGLILQIGAWVLQIACQQAKAWRDSGSPKLRVAVNLSVRQFRHAAIKETVQEALRQSGLPAEALELEITESMMMLGTEYTLSILRDLKAIGVRLSVDDFGTGYSSLSYLKRFPIDVLKIDQSFVRDIATDPDDAAIVSTIIAMAENLKLGTIAEGVENQQQADFLRQRRCRHVQGYFFGKPQPAGQISDLLSGG